jgi:XrtN system VIT domain protein
MDTNTTPIEVENSSTITTNHNEGNINTYYFGVGVTIISFLTYYFIHTFSVKDAEMSFVVNYILFLALFCPFLIKGFRNSFKDKENFKRDMIFPVIISGFVSCFALNRPLGIFPESTGWFYYTLFIISTIILFYPLIIQKFPRSKYVLNIILGVFAFIQFYFMMNLIPMMAVGFFGFILFGIGWHSYIPLFNLICSFNYASKFSPDDKKPIIPIMIGFGSSILIVVVLCSIWINRINTINEMKQENEFAQLDDVPKWVEIAKVIPADYLTKMILMEYTQNKFDFWNFNSLGSKNTEGKRVHDPLMNIVGLCSSKLELDDEERLKILESIFDNRVISENRLWSGKDLKIDRIQTNARIYPAQRMAYIEYTK